MERGLHLPPFLINQPPGLEVGIMTNSSVPKSESACQDKAEYYRMYYLKNKERINRRNNEYYQQNKEKRKLQGKKVYQANKEKVLERIKLYKSTHKEATALAMKKYHQTERGRTVWLRAKHKRRALEAACSYDSFDAKDVFERDNYICQLCGCKTRPDYKNSYHPKYPNLDHVVPLSKGGDHTKQNTQCLCRQCNITKNNKRAGDQLRMFD